MARAEKRQTHAVVGSVSVRKLARVRPDMRLFQMLRKESTSGHIHGRAHVRSEYCLAGCLTQSSAKADELIKSVILQGNDSEQGVPG